MSTTTANVLDSLPALIDGAELLQEIAQFLRRFVSYPSENSLIAHALWLAHCHAMDKWDSTPRIAFLSPEPGSGKTRALEVSELLVPRPVASVNATAAYLFRKVSDDHGAPTILFDEIDTLFGAKAKEHEEVRGLLNAGHRRGATAGRCVVKGKEILTEELPAYCAVAIAGLGNVPDTITSRSIIVRMRRRAPTETVEPFRRRLYAEQGHALRDRLAAWAKLIEPQLENAWPEMPAGITDRNADVWEALFAIADAAGGTWPTAARVAAVAHVADALAGTPSLGVRLLADVRTAFGNSLLIASEELLQTLTSMDEAPWGDLRGHPLDARGLSNFLRPYGIKSKTVRVGTRTPKGYTRDDFHDAWSRYLPCMPAIGCATSETPATDSNTCMPAKEAATSATTATDAFDTSRSVHW
jgi:hypothetical protein